MIETTETTIPVLAKRVGELVPEMGLDAFADARWKLDFLKEQIRDLETQWTDHMIELIEANGPQQIGPRRYFVGAEKKEKDRDVRKTSEKVLEVCAGDLDAFCCCLSSNAFKPGATKKLLGPAAFDECFETTHVKKLKSDGSEAKQLQCVDDRFIR